VNLRGSAPRRERGFEGGLVSKRRQVAEEGEASSRMKGCYLFEEEAAPIRKVGSGSDSGSLMGGVQAKDLHR
jgi:hypothetical protein